MTRKSGSFFCFPGKISGNQPFHPLNVFPADHLEQRQQTDQQSQISGGLQDRMRKMPSSPNGGNGPGGRKGQTEEDALQMLEDASLLPGDVGGEYNEMIPEWSVIRQIVPAGSQVPIGTEIGYVVSFGQEPAPRAEEDGLRDVYVASINEEFDLSSVIGPGSDSTQIRISIQLTQMVNGRTVTKTLLPAHSVSGDTKLSIHFDNIVGEYGVEEGNVEVVNAVTGKVLETYHLTFAHEE